MKHYVPNFRPPNKYRAQKTTVDGITFDSKAEAARYRQLTLMQQSGEIVGFTRQPSFLMFGGLAVITDYPLEAPYDDAMTYSLSLEGMGALTDLLNAPVSPDTMPEGSAALAPLTVVSVEGSGSGQTSIYVNPVKSGGNKYFYKIGEGPLPYPAYNEKISDTTWDGSAAITATTGQQIMIIETDSSGKALKAGIAAVTAKAGA